MAAAAAAFLASSFFFRSATRSAWIFAARAAMLSAVDLSEAALVAVLLLVDFRLLSQSSQLKDENDDLVDLVFLEDEFEGVYELYLEKPYC